MTFPKKLPTDDICFAVTTSIRSGVGTYCTNRRALWRRWPSCRNTDSQVGPRGSFISGRTVFTRSPCVAWWALALFNFQRANVLSVFFHSDFQAHFAQAKLFHCLVFRIFAANSFITYLHIFSFVFHYFINICFLTTGQLFFSIIDGFFSRYVGISYSYKSLFMWQFQQIPRTTKPPAVGE